MNFLEIISRIISITTIFFIFSVVLIIGQKYYFDFLSRIVDVKKVFSIFLLIKDLGDDGCLKLGEKVLIENEIFIGNEEKNDIVLNSNCDDMVKLGIYVRGDCIYAENFNNTENIKINNKNFLGKIKLNGNEEIFVLNVLFQIIRE